MDGFPKALVRKLLEVRWPKPSTSGSPTHGRPIDDLSFGGRRTSAPCRVFMSGWPPGGDKARKTIDWAERQLAVRGGELIAVARFIPGGRTAVTLSAGGSALPVAPLCPVRCRRGAHLGPLRIVARVLRREGVRGCTLEGASACARDLLRGGRWRGGCALVSQAPGRRPPPSRTRDPSRHACQPRSRHPAPGNLRRSETGQRRRPHVYVG